MGAGKGVTILPGTGRWQRGTLTEGFLPSSLRRPLHRASHGPPLRSGGGLFHPRIGVGLAICGAVSAVTALSVSASTRPTVIVARRQPPKRW